MKCTKLRRLLADGGPATLAGNREAEDHLVDCGECFAVLEALTEIDTLLPALESHDVADEVVEHLLARSALREPSESASPDSVGRIEKLRDRLTALSMIWARMSPAKRLGEAFDRARQARLRWGIVAVPAVVLIGIVSILTVSSTRRSTDAPLDSTKPYEVKQVKFKESPVDLDQRADPRETEESDRPSGRLPGSGAAVDGGEAGGAVSLRQPMLAEPEAGKKPQPATMPAPMPDPAVAETEVTDETIERAVEGSFEGAPRVTGVADTASGVDTALKVGRSRSDTATRRAWTGSEESEQPQSQRIPGSSRF